MDKFEIKLLYNEEIHFCTKTELLNFNITLPSAKLDVVSRPVSNGLIFSDDIPRDTQLVTFSLLPNIIDLSIGAKS